MGVFLGRKNIKRARIEHKCWGCCSKINIGQGYISHVSIDGGIQEMKLCEPCNDHLYECDSCQNASSDYEIYEGSILECITEAEQEKLVAWCPKCRLYSCGCKGVGEVKTVKEIMGGEANG